MTNNKKVAIITDTHFGVRNDQTSFLEHQKRFFDNIFFPTIKKENIQKIYHLGDLCDKRKNINFYTLNRMKLDFLDQIKEKMIIVLGNHCTFFKTHNSLNSPSELLEKYKNIEIISEPRHEEPDNNVLFIPWITSENREEALNLISKSTAKYCFGHLELQGFTMNSGSIADFGDDPCLFSKFEKVLTGHFHAKSSKGNVHYLGAPFQFTWNDENETRGFHIFDFETGSLTFIPNPYNMFNRIIYDDGIDKNSITDIKNTYVKLIVNKKTSQSKFDKTIKLLEEQQPIDLKIVELQNLSIENDILDGMETTPEIIKKYIEQIEIHSDKKKLQDIMIKLYQEALLIET